MCLSHSPSLPNLPGLSPVSGRANPQGALWKQKRPFLQSMLIRHSLSFLLHAPKKAGVNRWEVAPLRFHPLHSRTHGLLLPWNCSRPRPQTRSLNRPRALLPAYLRVTWSCFALLCFALFIKSGFIDLV